TFTIFGEADYFAVDHLLPGELDAAEHEPDRGMEPQRGAEKFFEQDEEPVAAIDVDQLMAGDRFAERGGEREHPGRQQDGGAEPSISYGAGNAVAFIPAGGDIAPKRNEGQRRGDEHARALAIRAKP